MEERIHFVEGSEPQPTEVLGEKEPPPKITGNDIAHVFANIFAPAPHADGKPLTPEQAREAFIRDYTATVGPVLDLVGFADAAGELNPSLLPPWLRVGIGIGAMVLGGIYFRAKYEPSSGHRPRVVKRKPRVAKRKPISQRLQFPEDQEHQTFIPEEEQPQAGDHKPQGSLNESP